MDSFKKSTEKESGLVDYTEVNEKLNELLLKASSSLKKQPEESVKPPLPSVVVEVGVFRAYSFKQHFSTISLTLLIIFYGPSHIQSDSHCDSNIVFCWDRR